MVRFDLSEHYEMINNKKLSGITHCPELPKFPHSLNLSQGMLQVLEIESLFLNPGRGVSQIIMFPSENISPFIIPLYNEVNVFILLHD